ncbi:hypothetical protein [Mucilaginibacter antarcticus]|uniref:hypothetical protein n=1 Tax=Mucilaginibacter antarcticus TaxID=1855725 RepID=UPI0036445133
MMPYSLHVALLLTACWLFYKVLLQNETYYHLNRVLLLACIALSFTLPLVPVPQHYSMRNAVIETTIQPVNSKAPVIALQKQMPRRQLSKQLPAQLLLPKHAHYCTMGLLVVLVRGDSFWR